MAFMADITYSPDDNGWYAHVWSKDGTLIADVPADGVLDSRENLVTAIHAQFGEIHLRNLD